MTIRIIHRGLHPKSLHILCVNCSTSTAVTATTFKLFQQFFMIFHWCHASGGHMTLEILVFLCLFAFELVCTSIINYPNPPIIDFIAYNHHHRICPQILNSMFLSPGTCSLWNVISISIRIVLKLRLRVISPCDGHSISPSNLSRSPICNPSLQSLALSPNPKYQMISIQRAQPCTSRLTLFALKRYLV